MPQVKTGQHRSAMVTGASRGIGRAIAMRLAEDGLDVSVTDLPNAKNELEETSKAISNLGVKSCAILMDVSSQEDVERAVTEHVKALGGIDVMVANAGIAVTAPLVETTSEQLTRTLDINLKGVYFCYQAAAKEMITQGRGGV